MTTAPLAVERTYARRFYVAMAAIFVLIAFGGFIPTYWAKLATGSFTGAPILHIHGTLFFAWTLLFFVQTVLIANGRRLDHRSWGMVGISLATGMGFTVVLAAINSMKFAERMGMGDAARSFSVVSLTALVAFAVLFSLAIINNRRPETHKRLMILAMIPLMQAAAGRVFALLFAPPGAIGPPPVMMATPPGLAVDMLIVAAMVYDWRTLGRPHKVYLIGGPAILAQQLLCVPLGASAGWMSVARWVEALVG